MRSNKQKIKAKFLEHLAKTANVVRSCKASGLPRMTAYQWRAKDEKFAKAWDDANEYGSDALEDEAIRRGHEGVLRPVYQGKEHVGDVREYSDTLLIFMLKARRPEKFKDRVESHHGGIGGGPMQFEEVNGNLHERIEAERDRILQEATNRVLEGIKDSGATAPRGNGSDLHGNGEE